MRQRRARELKAGPAEDPFLPIQRQMVEVLRHQHVRQQTRGRQTLVDHVRRHRRLQQRLTLAAHPFATHVALDTEHARRVIKLLTDVFADPRQRAAAVAACRLRLVMHFGA